MIFDELDAWMRFGSFRHYGGGHQILRGEGAGCAEMGSHFFNLALGLKATPADWIRSVYAPAELVGGHRTGKKIGLIRLYREGKAWAKNESEGIQYSTPDMELTWDWLEKFAPGSDEIDLEPARVTWTREPVTRIEFLAGYEPVSDQEVMALWNRVRVDS